MTSKTKNPYPKEWQYPVRLGTLGKYYNGLSGKTKEDFGHGKPFIKYTNIFNNSKIDINDFDYVNINENEKQNLVNYGDIFFTVSSETPDEVGTTSILLNNIKECYLNSFCFGFRLNNFNSFLPQYARYYFRSQDFRKAVLPLAQGSTRFNISKTQVIKLILPLPPLAEQKAIAEALSSIDNQIDLAKEQIAKYKELKKGAMQKLLSPKKHWVSKKLGEVCEVKTGATPYTQNPNYWNGNINWLSSGEINKVIIKYSDKTITQAGFKNSNTYIFPINTIFIAINGQGTTRGKVAISKIETTCNQSLIGFIANKKILEYKFLFYSLHNLYNDLRNITGEGRKGLSMNTLKPYIVKIPPTTDEQKNIAEKLTTLDNHIELLNIKLKNYELLKKGAMQKLLSGKVRLV